MIRRPKNLKERLLRIVSLHIFDLYMFRCVFHTSVGDFKTDVLAAEHCGDKVVLSFCLVNVEQDLTIESYTIVDDEDFIVARRYLATSARYLSGGLIKMTFEVQLT